MRPMSRTVRLVLANAREWTAWNSDIERSRRAYTGDTTAADDYARRNAATEARRRWVAKKGRKS